MPVLLRLAAALELGDEERRTFFELAGKALEEEAPPATGPWGGGAPVELFNDIAGVASPAFALDRAWNAVCWNERAERLFPDWLGSECDRNLLRYAFLNKQARISFESWLAWAGGVAADFRNAIADQPETTQVRDLIESLGRASPTFAKVWSGESCSPQGRTLWPVRRADGSVQCFMMSRLGSRCDSRYQALALLPFEISASHGAMANPVAA
jgi:hypothetical protein